MRQNEVTVTMSLDYVIWMMENPDKLNEWEKDWISIFRKLFNEELCYEQES